jgi:AraC-like DNA-binding protein
MSLIYCSHGMRNYRAKPIPLNSRGCWEFQFTLSGRNLLKKLDTETKTWSDAHNFFISSPDSIHGWSSKERTDSKIAVFHFMDVPEGLSDLCKGRTTLSTHVDERDLEMVSKLAQEMSPLVRSPSYTSLLEFEICCRRLSILFLEHTEDSMNRHPKNHNHHIVSASVAWFCAHMHEGIGIEETAGNLGYSVSQLRKIFRKTRNSSPHDIFEECRMNRARELIELTKMSMIEISLECGYSNQSSFSRAFKNYYDTSPVQMRRNHRPLYM